jgi:hypothetical protein
MQITSQMRRYNALAKADRTRERPKTKMKDEKSWKSKNILEAIRTSS